MNNNSSKQVLLSVIGVAILVVAVVGVSFAFFNYSRTGLTENTFEVGYITFNASGTAAVLDNAFPVDATEIANVTESTDDIAVMTVNISGETTYKDGIEFTVTAIPDADNTIPSYVTTTVGTTNLTAVTDLTAADKLNTTGETVLASGTIPADTEVNGTITIKMYVDKSKVLITDTETDAGTQAILGDRTPVKTADWNNKSYSFKINVWAVQTGGAEDPR